VKETASRNLSPPGEFIRDFFQCQLVLSAADQLRLGVEINYQIWLWQQADNCLCQPLWTRITQGAWLDKVPVAPTIPDNADSCCSLWPYIP
jgi:hypothetical protein